MKPPLLLKTILDISFFLVVLSFIAAIVAFGISIFMDSEFIPLELNNRVVTEFTPIAAVLITGEILIGGLVIYTIYVLRQLARNFFKARIFTKYQSAALKLIGQLIIIVTLFQMLLDILGTIFLEQKVRVGIQFDLSFSSFWFVLAIGLFFIYMSKAFERARVLKEENELTV